jgi:hypothetical protein
LPTRPVERLPQVTLASAMLAAAPTRCSQLSSISRSCLAASACATQAGLDFDAGGIRVERLAEAVTLIKGLLKGEQVAFAGRRRWTGRGKIV